MMRTRGAQNGARSGFQRAVDGVVRCPSAMGNTASSSSEAADFVGVIDSFVPDPVLRRKSGLRLLCLHGHGSNNDITQMQAEFLMLRDAHGVSCDFLHAEAEASPASDTFELFSDQPFHTWFEYWWFTRGTYSVGAPGGSLHSSLLRIAAVVKAHGPYDGIYVRIQTSKPAPL